ncbi:hypothetical protein [Stigmatella hybrida]|uniref:hypothetical protein n=1 Tax=Stigmatella hybrida TaxID=394097 RepID=UPI001CDB3852|nr:hypothetical protein [Stigmatella hybrida]
MVSLLTAHGGDALGGYEHAWPLDEPLPDGIGIAQGHVRVASALVLHVAHGDGRGRRGRLGGCKGAQNEAEQ